MSRLADLIDGTPPLIRALLREARHEWLFLLAMSIVCVATENWLAALLLLSRPIHASAAWSRGRLAGAERIRTLLDAGTNRRNR